MKFDDSKYPFFFTPKREFKNWKDCSKGLFQN